MNYLAFILSNPRFLAYGFMMLFFSSFGQTYFISRFNDDLRAEFGLSHGDVGFLFSSATFVAGLLMMWIGRKIDDVDLRMFTSFICAGLIAGCFMMATAEGVALLFVALFLLRLSGQGLMMHASFTSMTRYFEKERGRAISIASFGISAAQAVFPYLAYILILQFGWREAWQNSAVFLSIFLIPLMLWLLTGHGERHRQFIEETEEGREAAAGTTKGWVRRFMLRDPRFYLMIIPALAMPYLMTGFIFHQQHLSRAKGWPEDLLPQTFIAFSAVSFVVSILAGPLVDRFTARRLVPFNTVPVAIGFLCLALFDQQASAWIYMCLSGVTLGMGIPIGGSIWAEMYGPRNIGTVRAVTGSIFMMATALAPYTMGELIDIGISMNTMAYGGVVYIVMGISMVTLMVVKYWDWPDQVARREAARGAA